MRFYVAIALCLGVLPVQALESLRVDNRLIVVGDSPGKVKELLGNPSSRHHGAAAAKRSSKGSSRKAAINRVDSDKANGEEWQYLRNGHTITVIFAHGKVTHIDDVVR